MTKAVMHAGIRGILAAIACGLLGACHTVAGMGEDMSAAGQAIHNTATK